MAKKKSKKKHKKSSKSKVVNQQANKQSAKSTKPASKAKPPKAKTSNNKVAVESDNRKYLVFILLAIAGALLIAVLVLANQSNQAKNDVTNTGQEDLLKVQPANPETLQPNGSNNTNPQQSSPSPQGDTGSASDIQPQTPVTPEQQEQVQQ